MGWDKTGRLRATQVRSSPKQTQGIHLNGYSAGSLLNALKIKTKIRNYPPHPMPRCVPAWLVGLSCLINASVRSWKEGLGSRDMYWLLSCGGEHSYSWFLHSDAQTQIPRHSGYCTEKKQQPLGRGQKAVLATKKITFIIFALDKKIESPNGSSPARKPGRGEALAGSPMAGGRGAALTPPSPVFVTQPRTLGIRAPYPGQPRPWGHPLGPVPGRGRGQPFYPRAAR